MRMENLESQLQAMRGPVAPVLTPLDPLHTQQVPDASSAHRTATWSQPPAHSQQQSHVLTASFGHQAVPHPEHQSHAFISSSSHHLSSQDINSSNKEREEEEEEVDRLPICIFSS